MGAKQKQQNKKKSQEKPRTLKSLLTKGAVFTAVVVCVIVILEKRRLFVEDSMNNHVEWKWDCYYRMQQYIIPIDVLLVGSSQLLTGLTPNAFPKTSRLNGLLRGAQLVGRSRRYVTISELLE